MDQVTHEDPEKGCQGGTSSPPLNVQEVSVQTFRESLASLGSLFVSMLQQYSDDELSQMRLYLVVGLNAGYAITVDGTLVNMHNGSGNRGLGPVLVASAIAHGATNLDHYDVPILTRIYGDAGFLEIRREEWNDAYAPPGWPYERFGRPDVVWRKLK